MKTRWINRIVGFVLGFIVAALLFFVPLRQQASPEVDIYERVNRLEKRVGALEGSEKVRSDRERAEERAMRMR